jgi:hypothetical protein
MSYEDDMGVDDPKKLTKKDVPDPSALTEEEFQRWRKQNDNEIEESEDEDSEDPEAEVYDEEYF